MRVTITRRGARTGESATSEVTEKSCLLSCAILFEILKNIFLKFSHTHFEILKNTFQI